jgi:hypothetical protein
MRGRASASTGSVIPAKARIQAPPARTFGGSLDSRFRGNDIGGFCATAAKRCRFAPVKRLRRCFAPLRPYRVTRAKQHGLLATRSFGDRTGRWPVSSPKLLVAITQSARGGVKVRRSPSKTGVHRERPLATDGAGSTLTPSTTMARTHCAYVCHSASSSASPHR